MVRLNTPQMSPAVRAITGSVEIIPCLLCYRLVKGAKTYNLILTVVSIQTKSGIIYFWPFEIQKYYKLIKKLNFKRDWVLLSNRAGQKAAKVTDVD